jgi:hypothetical protein
MRILDRLFGGLMFLGGIGHGIGSYQFYKNQPMNLLWALSASFATFLLAAINLLRTGHRGNPALAWISFAGCLVQIGFAVSFGLLIGNVFDFRPSATAIIAFVLAAFSLRSATQKAA